MSAPRVVIEVASADLPYPHAVPHCKQCTCATGYLARYIKRNGQVCIRWVCGWCEGYTTGQDLPLEVLRAHVPAGTLVDTTLAAAELRDQLPLRKDNTAIPQTHPECLVCGDDAHHEHHWAPRSIFPEWPYGLTVSLCVAHHREWHDRMRAHGLRWPHELEAA